jgi:hypothetical protein
MLTRPYQQAFGRIRAEYQEMPGMRLTLEQVRRLSGVDRTVCERVLEDLVRAKFLSQGPDGNYALDRHGDPSRFHPANPSFEHTPVRRATR